MSGRGVRTNGVASAIATRSWDMEQAAKSIACGTQALSLFRGLFVYPAMGFNPWRRGRGETPCRSARPYGKDEEQEDRQALRRIKSGIDFARPDP